MEFNWRKWLVDFLLKIVKSLSDATSSNKPKVRKDSVFSKDVHIPTWIIGVLVYLILVIIFLFEMGINYNTVIAVNIMISGIMFFGIYFFRKFAPVVAKCDDSMMFIGLMLIVFIFIIMIVRNSGRAHFLITPIPAAAMILNILLGPLVAFIISLILVIIMTMLYDYNFAVFITMFFMCLIAIFGTRDVVNRKSIMTTGSYIGIFNLLTILVMHFLYILPGKDIFPLFLWGVGNGIVCSIITIGLLPYLESLFSIISNIKLLELADFTQPVLKHMMIEVPGTYHHSLIVGNLGEAAAREIGANPLLVRVGAYYHDIGKLEKPEYFVENKPRHMENKHDELTPNLSSLIISSHVKDGVNMAKKLKFGNKLIDIIEQHHGDSLISYFYHKAVQEYGEEEVDESKYRYPGPKPKSKEAAIVMLADTVEAATHSEEDFSHSYLKNLVNKIINQKFIDGQLEETEITLSDLNVIGSSFVKTLVGIYHNRVAYPDAKKEEDDEDSILK